METRRPWTMSERWRWWFDAALVAGSLVFCLFVGLAGDLGLTVTAVMVAQIVPLWWRRRHPAVVLGLVAVFSATQLLFTADPLPSQLAFPIAVYSAGRWASPWVRAAAVPLSLCAAVAAALAWTLSWDQSLRTAVTPFVGNAGIALAAWALGVAGAQRDRHLASLLDAAEQARRTAERDVALAAQDERARIAREMHDVVAHGLSVIVVQADGARYAAAKDPQVAVDTLGTIAATGRESLAEMRRLLGLLRTGDSGVQPQPVLADVEHLLEEARAGGTRVEADLPEEWPEVPGGVGLAAYRVVQEALTNVRKHAGPGAAVQVLVRVGSAAVRLEVRDDGRGAAAAGDGHGLGLRGMRERVGVHDGTVDAGPVPGGGWLVSATIPL